MMQKHPLFRVAIEKDDIWATYLWDLPLSGRGNIAEKMAERDAREDAERKAARKQILLKKLMEKQDQKLDSMTEDDLNAELDAL